MLYCAEVFVEKRDFRRSMTSLLIPVINPGDNSLRCEIVCAPDAYLPTFFGAFVNLLSFKETGDTTVI